MLIIIVVKRIIAFISIFTMLSSAGATGDVKWADSYEGMNFPIISAGEKEEGTTRVMSFNIRCLDVRGVEAKDRYSIVARQITEIMPDSFGVQEANGDWMDALSILLPQYGYVGTDRDYGLRHGNGEHNAIFYLKSKYIPLTRGTFWLSETPLIPTYALDAGCRRICTWVVLFDKETHKKLVHVNSHFDHVSDEARVFEANRVIDFIKKHFDGKNVVLTLDMNSFPWENPYIKTAEYLNDAYRVAEKSQYRSSFHSTRPDYSTNSNIDFIFCSDNIRVKEYRTVTEGIDGRMVSDHFPIYADIVF